MIVNCDECPCRNNSECNLGYKIYPFDINGEGAFLPASDNCKLVKIVTQDDGEILPEKFGE